MADLAASDMPLEDQLEVLNMIDLDNYDYPSQGGGGTAAMVDEYSHFEAGAD